MERTDTAQQYSPFTTVKDPPLSPQPPGEPRDMAHPAVVRGFAQTFGLHPGMAFLTLGVDAMLFPFDASGVGFPVSLLASLVLGVIVFRAQRKWYGDDDESAAIKALILAFLTAIPTPLPAIFYLPAGVVGLFRRK
jgi:hypothetical protein